MPEAGGEAHEALAGISAGRLEVLEQALELREAQREGTGLDARTLGLGKSAALGALYAHSASYACQASNAVEGGASADDVLGALRAIAPQVGIPRVLAAAPQIMLALGLLEEEPE